MKKIKSKKFKEALKFLNASNLSPQYFGISQTYFSKMIGGKKPITNAHKEAIAKGLECLILLLAEAKNELINEVEDKYLKNDTDN